MAKRKSVRTLVASNIGYIDPLGCGSTVGYKITQRRYLSAEVTLADCNRKIDWYFSDDDIPKIDKALALLQEFRKAFITAKASKRRRARK